MSIETPFEEADSRPKLVRMMKQVRVGCGCPQRTELSAGPGRLGTFMVRAEDRPPECSQFLVGRGLWSVFIVSRKLHEGSRRALLERFHCLPNLAIVPQPCQFLNDSSNSMVCLKAVQNKAVQTGRKFGWVSNLPIIGERGVAPLWWKL